MSESSEIWLLPDALLEIRWVARISLWLMSACSCAWLVFASYDVYQLGTLSGEQAFAMLTLLAWLVFMQPFGTKVSLDKPMALFWFNDPQHGLKARTQRQTSKPLIQDSHWRTKDGQAVQVQVNIDIGTHLLLTVRLGKVVSYHWVRDTDVAGPWRWRINTDASQPANGQPRKQSQLAKRQARHKDAWHHR